MLSALVLITLAQLAQPQTGPWVEGAKRGSWYVDSVNGNDSNPGTSPAAALRTIGWYEGVCRGCQAIEAEPPLNYGGGTMFIAFPSEAPVANRNSGRARWGAQDSGGGANGLLGYYVHTDGGSTYPAECCVNSVRDRVAEDHGAANAASVLVDGCLVKNGTAGVSVASVPRVDVLASTFCDGGASKLQMAASANYFDSFSFIGNRVMPGPTPRSGTIHSRSLIRPATIGPRSTTTGRPRAAPRPSRGMQCRA